MTGKRLAKEGIYRVKRLDRGRGWRVDGGTGVLHGQTASLLEQRREEQEEKKKKLGSYATAICPCVDTWDFLAPFSAISK